ncbi:MAG: hypothetical protein COA94_06775 [Rickettsiales bacterium]|nr:MAG: hypothetical protein COA94_06775 [Rickettsiales bacterium]
MSRIATPEQRASYLESLFQGLHGDSDKIANLSRKDLYELLLHAMKQHGVEEIKSWLEAAQINVYTLYGQRQEDNRIEPIHVLLKAAIHAGKLKDTIECFGMDLRNPDDLFVLGQMVPCVESWLKRVQTRLAALDIKSLKQAIKNFSSDLTQENLANVLEIMSSDARDARDANQMTVKTLFNFYNTFMLQEAMKAGNLLDTAEIIGGESVSDWDGELLFMLAEEAIKTGRTEELANLWGEVDTNSLYDDGEGLLVAAIQAEDLEAVIQNLGIDVNQLITLRVCSILEEWVRDSNDNGYGRQVWAREIGDIGDFRTLPPELVQEVLNAKEVTKEQANTILGALGKSSEVAYNCLVHHILLASAAQGSLEADLAVLRVCGFPIEVGEFSDHQRLALLGSTRPDQLEDIARLLDIYLNTLPGPTQVFILGTAIVNRDLETALNKEFITIKPSEISPDHLRELLVLAVRAKCLETAAGVLEENYLETAAGLLGQDLTALDSETQISVLGRAIKVKNLDLLSLFGREDVSDLGSKAISSFLHRAVSSNVFYDIIRKWDINLLETFQGSIGDIYDNRLYTHHLAVGRILSAIPLHEFPQIEPGLLRYVFPDDKHFMLVAREIEYRGELKTKAMYELLEPLDWMPFDLFRLLGNFLYRTKDNMNTSSLDVEILDAAGAVALDEDGDPTFETISRIAGDLSDVDLA